MVISGGLIKQTAVVRRKARTKDIDEDRAWCEWCVRCRGWSCNGWEKLDS